MSRFHPALLLATLAAAACAPEPPPNVVLVVVDTLRADATGPYGGPVPTPALDLLAREGVLFEAAFAPSPSTAPSHATILTGQEVRRHGVVRNGEPLPQVIQTLAEAFWAAGYATAGFVSSFVLDPRFGWNQGFEAYDAELPRRQATIRKPSYEGAFWDEDQHAGFDRRAGHTTIAARKWLASAPEPFFLFVHYFDPHTPYGAPSAYRDVVRDVAIDVDGRSLDGVPREELEQLVREYHAEVMYADAALALLLEDLVRGTEHPALIAVTADHGEGLGQHHWLEHAVTLYDEQIRVPLLLHFPGVLPPGVRLRTPVGLVDLAPTLLDLAGLPPLPQSDGRSLAAAARAGTEPEARPVFGHRRLVSESTRWGKGLHESVRRGDWKYIHATDDPDALFDLAADPGELDNRAGREPQRSAELRALLDAHRSAMPPEREPEPLSDETLDRLRALGYVEPAEDTAP
ncbi:MAG: sulfatase [Myxococcota bacterium]|nr:sulfatase [Myxococcota bacterium]